MEAVAFVRMLNKSLSRSKSSRKRHILRLGNASDYYAIARAIRKSKGLYKHLSSVKTLPLIHALSYQGSLHPSIREKLPNAFEEEDIPLSVHALPGSGTPLAIVMPAERSVSPFVPSSIRSLRVPAVWKRSRGDKVKIGIIDTGVDYQHPDLQSVLGWGINLINPRTLPFDDNGHGTHIAGTIAATGKYYMTGIAPRSVLLPVKAFDHNGSAYVSDIIKGIDWCVQNGVNIINMSFGMKQKSQAMLDAVRNAKQSGVIIVASSGNDGKRGFIDYPARYPQTISVGALDKKGGIAPFSNRGRRIDVFAPGEGIFSTWPKNRYHEMNGTSMATSHVTGILALIMSVRPKITPAQIKRLVAAAQVPLSLKTGKLRIPGRIDAVRAFRHLKGI